MQNESVQKLKEAIFVKRPVLKELFDKYQDVSLLDFIKEQYNFPETQGSERNSQLVSVVSEEVGRLLGEEVKENLALQLERFPVAITTDHHGPLSDSGYLTSNMLAAVNFAGAGYKNILVLSCANISFDNSSFPRGHLFHSLKAGEITENQLVFFPRKVRPLTVFGHPAYTLESITEVKKRVEGWVREGVIESDKENKLNHILDQVYSSLGIFEWKYFSEQVTVTNFNLWRMMVEGLENAPSLIYLEQENIVNKLITRFHLNDSTLINKILFEGKYHDLLMKYLDGISGGFSLEKKSGTFLFWALPKDQKYRLQLWRQGNQLVASDQSYSVNLNPEAIKKAIDEKELIPSTLLSFLILSFYHGLNLVGGGGQTTYFSQMKEAFIRMEQELDENIENVITDRLSFPYPAIFLESGGGELVPSTTLDLLVSGGVNFIDKIKETFERTVFGQPVLRLMPELYRMMYKPEEQSEELLRVKESEIDKLTGFESAVKVAGKV